MGLMILSEEGSKFMQPFIIKRMVDEISMSFDVLRCDYTSQEDLRIHYARIRHLCSDLHSIAMQISNQKFKPKDQNEVNF